MIITLKIDNPHLEEQLFLFLKEQKQSLEEITIEALQFFINTFKKNKNNNSTAFFNTLRNRNLKIDKSIDIDNIMNEMNNGLY